MSANWFFP